MDEKLILKDKDNYKFIVMFLLFLMIFSAYLIYSINKFNMLSSRSVVKTDVLMRVIQHNVKSICPHCAYKGMPTCPKCSVQMHWNGYRGEFVCSSCGKGGFPVCPKCNNDMVWIEAK